LSEDGRSNSRSTGKRRTLEELLLKLGLCDFDLDSLVNLLLVTAAVVCVVLDGGGEESVDEGGLAETGLASNLKDCEYFQVAIGCMSMS
jgi:hypothetical protein